MDNAVTVQLQCRLCKRERSLTLPLDGFRQFARGVPAQLAYPDVSAEDREQLISGVCPTCWKEMMDDLGDPEVADPEDLEGPDVEPPRTGEEDA